MAAATRHLCQANRSPAVKPLSALSNFGLEVSKDSGETDLDYFLQGEEQGRPRDDNNLGASHVVGTCLHNTMRARWS